MNFAGTNQNSFHQRKQKEVQSETNKNSLGLTSEFRMTKPVPQQ